MLNDDGASKRLQEEILRMQDAASLCCHASDFPESLSEEIRECNACHAGVDSLSTDVRQALFVFSIKAAEFVIAQAEQFGRAALLIARCFQGRPYQFDFTTSDYCLEIQRKLVT